MGSSPLGKMCCSVCRLWDAVPSGNCPSASTRGLPWAAVWIYSLKALKLLLFLFWPWRLLCCFSLLVPPSSLPGMFFALKYVFQRGATHMMDGLSCVLERVFFGAGWNHLCLTRSSCPASSNRGHPCSPP